MGAIYDMLMARAETKYGSILPCGETFIDGFRCDDEYVQFWFNTPDNSTHLVYQKLNGSAS